MTVTATVSRVNDRESIAVVKIDGQESEKVTINATNSLTPLRPLNILIRYNVKRGTNGQNVLTMVGAERPSEADIDAWVNNARQAVSNPLFMLAHLSAPVKDAMKFGGLAPKRTVDGKSIDNPKSGYAAHYLPLWRAVRVDQNGNPLSEGRAYEGILTPSIKFGKDGKLVDLRPNASDKLTGHFVTMVAPSTKNLDGAYRNGYLSGNDALTILDYIPNLTETVQYVYNAATNGVRPALFMYGTAPTASQEVVKPRDVNAKAEAAALARDPQTAPIAGNVAPPATNATDGDRVAVLEQKFDALMAMLANKLG